MNEEKRNIVFFLVLSAVTIGFIVFLYKFCLNDPDPDPDIAVTNAIKYVENKYGFTPEIDDVRMYEFHPKAQMEGEPRPGNAVVSMSYKGKSFTVVASAKNYTDNAADDYQCEEICQAILARVNDEVPNGTPMSLYINNYHYPDEECRVGKDSYYDGENILTVLKNTNIKLIMCYRNTEFKDCPFLQEISEGQSVLTFVSFDSQDTFEECTEFGKFLPANPYNYSSHYSYDIEVLARSELYINDMWQSGESENGHIVYEFRDTGEKIEEIKAIYINKETDSKN